MAIKSCGVSCCENGRDTFTASLTEREVQRHFWEGMELSAQQPLSRKHNVFFAEHLDPSVIVCFKVLSVGPFVGGAYFSY